MTHGNCQQDRFPVDDKQILFLYRVLRGMNHDITIHFREILIFLILHNPQFDLRIFLRKCPVDIMIQNLSTLFNPRSRGFSKKAERFQELIHNLTADMLPQKRNRRFASLL